jgi:integrase
MPKKARELSAVEVKRLTSVGLHAVGGVAGLHLQVKETGARSWILRAQIGARRRDIGLGGYPDVTLAGARDSARDAREQIRQGIDPVEARRAARDAIKAAQARRMTFDDAAKQCHQLKVPEFRNKKHCNDWINSLNRYVSPVIGDKLVSEIGLTDVVNVLKPIWQHRTETATRVRQRIESVLSWATVSGYRSGENPARWNGHLDQVLQKPSRIRKVQHFAALNWQQMGAFMAELREREGMGASALEYLILTAARSGEVRLATWDEIDVAGKLWTIPPERMKAGKRHRIPLSQPAIALLNNLPRSDESLYVFSTHRGGPLSDMSISAVCRRMEVPAVPHGFRSTFKDWCRISTAYPDEVSELALAHVNSDATRAAYARDELLPKRARLMRDWAKYCGSINHSATVSSIRASS